MNKLILVYQESGLRVSDWEIEDWIARVVRSFKTTGNETWHSSTFAAIDRLITEILCNQDDLDITNVFIRYEGIEYQVTDQGTHDFWHVKSPNSRNDEHLLDRLKFSHRDKDENTNRFCE